MYIPYRSHTVESVGMRIGELARRTGVGVSTLRAWERRFHFPVPERTPSGQRAYDESDIDRVDAVVRLVAEGLTLPAAINRVASGGPAAPPGGEAGSLFLGQILDAAEQGVWVSKDGRTLYANRRMADMMGYAVDELIAIPVLEFFPPDELQAVRERTAEVRAGTPLHFTTKLRRADGSLLLAEITTTPLLSPAGRYGGAVAVVSDVTRRKADEIHARVRASLLDSVGEAVISTNPDGTIAYLNSEAERLFGYRSAEVAGRSAITQLAAPQSAEDAERILMDLLEGKRYVGRQKATRRDGTTFAAHVTAWSVRDDDNEIVGLVAIVRDQTERTQLERDAHKRKLQAETLALLGAQALREQTAPRLVVDRLMSEAVDATRRLLAADDAVVLECDHGREELRLRMSSPPTEDVIVVPPNSQSFAGYVTLARKAVVVDDTSYDGRFETCHTPTGAPAASAVGAPIFGPGGIVGVLVAHSATTDKFDEVDAHFVQGVANIVGTTLR